MSESCLTCRCVHRTGETLTCRRYPPHPTERKGSQFPEVRPDDWCGEFLLIPETPVDLDVPTDPRESRRRGREKNRTRGRSG